MARAPAPLSARELAAERARLEAVLASEGLGVITASEYTKNLKHLSKRERARRAKTRRRRR